ncbi:MAG: helix-turn-helix domain-containing protein [Acidimicrobiia bacterium]
MSGNRDEYLVVGPQSLGRAIHEFRVHRHVSQQELVDQADIHRSYRSALQSGSTTEALNRIMRALDLLDLEVVVRERGTR